ncbi:hypothetical protein N9852_02605 [Alphaproteobacteria bacterium]|jgi:hypothetical protein|nr:hypothetical protein [Alphaproteobacteria bacterium]MDB9824802.1 hypothetical protein [Alphaproteobacteria bacterium]|tara:strand:- start:37 stop:405 length:369 start_codon:yes stop_codon:yes gene_type:complete
MKFFILYIIFFINVAKAEIIENFPYACICDRSINTFQYLDCKNKMGSTFLELEKNNTAIKNSFDEKLYVIQKTNNLLSAIYFNENYQSSITIDQQLLMIFSINYPEYNKEWSYKLQCISTKQ